MVKFFALVSFVMVIICGPALAQTADTTPNDRITINGATYQRVVTPESKTKSLDQVLSRRGTNREATCISGDGQQVCACGALPCVGGATTCGCIIVQGP
jgi:hypothetical protein